MDIVEYVPVLSCFKFCTSGSEKCIFTWERHGQRSQTEVRATLENEGVVSE